MNKTRVLTIFVIVLFIWNIILSSSFSNIQNNGGQIINEYEINGISSDLTGVIKDVKSSVVSVESLNKGTGFIYKSEDNKFYVVTSYHVVEDTSLIKVCLANSLKLDAKLVGYDIYSDIALLEVEAPFKVQAVKLGDVLSLKDGEFLISVGYPNSDLTEASELCMVSKNLKTVLNSINVSNKEYLYYQDMILTSGSLSSGFSGAGLFDMNGFLVGMVEMKDDNQTLSISVNEMKIVVDKLLANSEVYKRQFGVDGIYVNQMENYLKTGLNISVETLSGMYVKSVYFQSFGHSIGLKQGDIIVSINDIKIDSFNDYLNASYLDTNEYNIVVLRNDETISLKGSVE